MFSRAQLLYWVHHIVNITQYLNHDVCVATSAESSLGCNEMTR